MPLMAGFSTTEQAEDLAGVVPRTSPNSIKAQMPFDLKENELVYMLFHTAELNAVHLRLFFSGIHQGTSLDVSDLNRGFRAAGSLLGFYLSLPSRRDLTFNNSEWLQLSLALTVSAKLIFAASHPSLGTAGKVQASLDLKGLLSQIVLRLSTLEHCCDIDSANNHPSIFKDFTRRVQRLQKWFDDRYARVQGAAATQAALDPSASGPPGELMDLPQLSGSELLLPDLLAFDGLATLDQQLAAFFPDMQMGDAMGDWSMYPGGL
ncbi:hypothetical protein DIS24_g10444 [Lasiodiplodia hormozganensis]|uniref:Uncharacterized protein n=1 Tax=Lasiodiplodia hormozganensis TaxID=869390 RepID=A0AA39XPE6_9PEZI|nr:hypothetical protein DIS24_g10444 [Lasiodiplodia hormozganensis]